MSDAQKNIRLFKEIVGKELGFKMLRLFLVKELSEEHIDFWKDVESYRKLPSSQISEKGTEIFKKYIDDTAPHQVNIPFNCKKNIVTIANKNEFTSTTYDESQSSVIDMLVMDSFHRFLKNDYYKAYLNPKLEFMDWYFGDLGRFEADELLKGASQPCFLVRDSSQKDSYALSTYSPKHGVVHTLISHEPGKGYFIGKNTNSFPNVIDLIAAHQQKEMYNYVPLDKNEAKLGVRRVRINIEDTNTAVTIPSDSSVMIKHLVKNIIKRNGIDATIRMGIFSNELNEFLGEEKSLNSYTFTKPLVLKKLK